MKLKYQCKICSVRFRDLNHQIIHRKYKDEVYIIKITIRKDLMLYASQTVCYECMVKLINGEKIDEDNVCNSSTNTIDNDREKP